MRFLSVFFWCILIYSAVAAQDSVSVLKKPVQTDSAAILITAQNSSVAPVIPAFDSAKNYLLQKLLQLNVKSPGVFAIQKEKIYKSKDWLFYYIIALLLIFGVIRISYARYFKDLFRFFFRTSLRINQIREQLVQSGLQSLMFNAFFALSFGLYIYLLVNYFNASVQINALLIPVIATACLFLLYAGKFIFLKISGWIFSIANATETYTFIVFLINKVAGIVILPFIIVIAFSGPLLAAVSVTLSLAIVTGLFIYRFLRAYQPVQAEVKVSRMHFLFFFLAIEIAPLLVIYKVLIRFF